MIRILCPSCGSKLNAKDELVGQTRKCPKCGQPVLITAEEPAAIAATPVATPPVRSVSPALPDKNAGESELPTDRAANEKPIASPHMLKRLNRDYHYLICDKSRVFALWENDGHGWQLKSNTGLVSARRNQDMLSGQGDFKLVELKFAILPEGKQLVGLHVYQLAARWALIALAQDEDTIVEKIVRDGCLNREQKNAVRGALKEQFMREVWQNATAVIEYLGNLDFHSPGV